MRDAVVLAGVVEGFVVQPQAPLGKAPCLARRAEPSPPAMKRHQELRTARLTAQTREPVPGMIARPERLEEVRRLLRTFRVVGLLGPRQVGKATLARQIAGTWRGPTTVFDLERAEALARLREPELALGPLRGLVVVDEIQRRPDLFPVPRVLADRRPLPTRFLVLGSASPELLKQTSETLAGPHASST